MKNGILGREDGTKFEDGTMDYLLWTFGWNYGLWTCGWNYGLWTCGWNYGLENITMMFLEIKLFLTIERFMRLNYSKTGT